MINGQEGSPFPAQFWTLPSYDQGVANSVLELVTRLNRYQSYRRENNIRCLRMYTGTSWQNMSPYSYARGAVQLMSEDRPRYNLASSCVDTLYSRICKNKPRILALTERGDDQLQRRSQKLSQYVVGMMKQTKSFDRARECFRDGCIFDVGTLKMYREGNRICVERVMPNELYVDEVDGFYNDPSHIHQVKYVLKDVLRANYPKSMHLSIDQSNNALEGEGIYASNTDTRYAVVIESWHKKSGEGAKDGRHTICVSNCVLFDEEYDKEEFPFVHSRWSKPNVGFWGQSLVYRLLGKQIELNKMLRVIQDSFHLGAAFKIFVEHGSRVAQEHLSNALGSIVYYTGTPPTYTVPQTVHPEYFSHLKWLIESSYQEAGISMLSAQSKKPSGLDAAVAMREYQDIESERFATVAQDYDELHVEIARRIVDLSKEIDADGGKLEVKAESKKFVETIKWKDVEVDQNQMVLQLFPTSMLPHDPAGRIQMVTELMQANLIDQDVGLSLLEFPDTEAAMDVRLAPLRDIEFTIDKIIADGEYNPPEPYQNLQLGLKLFQSHYLKAREEGVKESKLQMLRDWMSSAHALMQQQQQAQMLTQQQAGMQLPPGAAPQGNPAGAPPAPGQEPAPDQVQPQAVPGK